MEQRQNQERETGGGPGHGGEATHQNKAITLLYANAQSINSKIDELKVISQDLEPDIILLTETWCNSTIENAALTIENYKLETDLRNDRCDTANGIGGGLLVYSKQDICARIYRPSFHEYKPKTLVFCHTKRAFWACFRENWVFNFGHWILPYDKFHHSKFNQFCAFSVVTKSDNLNVILIYRPPCSGQDNLTELCEILRGADNNTILIGDFNMHGIDWEKTQAIDARGRELLETATEEGLQQLVNFPTHTKGNTLDLLLTNCPDKILEVTDARRVGRSDH
jgi:hypothetical protein